jgi:uncharacterized 2Fe-2S/4Fe-4S cluster protein (DUF4445 family)
LNKEIDIIFLPDGVRKRISLGSKVLDVLRSLDIDIQSPCNDLGLCGRCRIKVESKDNLLNKITEYERRFFSDSEIRHGFRLACQAIASKTGTIKITIPEESRITSQRRLVNGIMPDFEKSPSITKILVELNTSEKLEYRSDFDRILTAFKREVQSIRKMSIGAIRQLPEYSHDKKGILTAVIKNNSDIISLELGDTREKSYGLAIDLGTTTIVAYLVDLKTGFLINVNSAENPQIAFGEDLISRIVYWSTGLESREKLQEIVIRSINKLIDEVCEKLKISPDEIYDMTLTGNTVMHHILFGISPKYVGQSPFPAVINGALDIKSTDRNIRINSEAYIHTLPLIAGFVGSDTVAGIIATELYKSDDMSMLIDVGTNAEIVIGNKERIVCCSAPAGPAFEGGRISHGMRASKGAIESVWIYPGDYNVGYLTVDHGEPKGICGSGIIDIIAQLLKTGIIDNNGHFRTSIESPRIRSNKPGLEFIISWKDETATGKEITITSRDIQEILLAKAAVYSGASILMKYLDLTNKDIKNLYIAGAFGTYVDVANSMMIGMYPEVDYNVAKFVGNTSGSGARITLMSHETRNEAERIAREVEYIDLSQNELFEKEFRDALILPNRNKEKFPNAVGILGRIK